MIKHWLIQLVVVTPAHPGNAGSIYGSGRDYIIDHNADPRDPQHTEFGFLVHCYENHNYYSNINRDTKLKVDNLWYQSTFSSSIWFPINFHIEIIDQLEEFNQALEHYLKDYPINTECHAEWYT